MLRITQIKLKMSEPVTALPKKIGKKLQIKNFSPLSWKVVKESIDARHKPDIFFVYTVDFEVENEEALFKKCAGMKSVNLSKVVEKKYDAPVFRGKVTDDIRPVVVGFGPCGMFAALILAEAGLCPIVLEMGRNVDDRTRDVERFWETGELDVISNVQFGEGGAGTFSDGKLTTGIKDLRIGKVNEELIQAGADPAIAYRQAPHIGTDVLRIIVKNIREKIIALGGEVRFETKVTGISTVCQGEKMRVESLILNKGDRLKCSSVVFAPGNSARDTFRMMYDAGVKFEEKPFSVGVRIEHPQTVIDEVQYGVKRNDTEGRLGAAAYKLSYHCKDGRGVYTFCMCPGGFVVGAASQENCVVTNGMSYYARDGKNANSALLVSVEPSDYMKNENPLSGIYFQEELERRAYDAGGGRYFAPVQRVGEFLGTSGEDAPKSGGKTSALKYSGKVEPTYKPGVTEARLDEVLPDFVTAAMREALPEMGRRLSGFDMEEAVMTGIETRSSSPVRIPRNDRFESVNISGIFPGGEGAGYAGGIMSAAVDGIKIAEAVTDSINADFIRIG